MVGASIDDLGRQGLVSAGSKVNLRAFRNSIWRIALLSLPGTIAHELAHFVVGALLLAKPRGFSIWPTAQGDTWRLGSVSFGKIGLFNGAFVALAPLLLLPIAWLCVVHVLLPLWNDSQWGWWLLGGYLTATPLFAALPSFPDLNARRPIASPLRSA